MALAPVGEAITITLSAVDSGYYRSGLGNDGTYNNGGFSTGVSRNISNVMSESRGWLGFNLSSVTETIISATLELDSSDRNGSGQTVTFRDVLTPYADLGTGSDIAKGIAIFNDLGSGTIFATGTHTAGIINTFTLNASAISSLNATSSFWAIGLRNPSINSPAFGFTAGADSNPPDHLKLILTTESASVPDAGATLSLLGISLLSLAALRQRLHAA